jgi:hypothetical protein
MTSSFQNIETYKTMLAIQKHRLDDELEMHPSIMQSIAEQLAERSAKALFIKDELAQLESEIIEDIRNVYEKVVVSEIDGRVKRNPKRIELFKRYQVAKVEHDKWSGLFDAWKAKGFALKTMADLFTAQYFTLATHQVRQRKERDLSYIEQESTNQSTSTRRKALL